MDRIEKYLSIVTHVIAIVAIVPLLLVMTGNPYFQQLLKLRSTEVMGVKGFTYYEPAPESHNTSQSWLLASNSVDASLSDLNRGDILLALHDVNLRVSPTTSARRAYFVPKSRCVMVLDPESVSVNGQPGGWVYVGTTSCN